LGGLKLWTTIRDIERLGLNRMAREDSAALTVPTVQKAGPATTVTPSHPVDSSQAPVEDSTVPATDVPVSRSAPTGESALLVGADVGPGSRVR
jgi:hypothetical protein